MANRQKEKRTKEQKDKRSEGQKEKRNNNIIWMHCLAAS